MQQSILKNKDPEVLGKELIQELTKLNTDFVIIHTSTFYDHIDEFFKAVIFYHI